MQNVFELELFIFHAAVNKGDKIPPISANIDIKISPEQVAKADVEQLYKELARMNISDVVRDSTHQGLAGINYAAVKKERWQYQQLAELPVRCYFKSSFTQWMQQCI